MMHVWRFSGQQVSAMTWPTGRRRLYGSTRQTPDHAATVCVVMQNFMQFCGMEISWHGNFMEIFTETFIFGFKNPESLCNNVVLFA